MIIAFIMTFFVCGILGLVVLLIGIILLIVAARQEASCTLTVDAYIEGYKKYEDDEYSGYFPIYAYEVDGNIYKVTSKYMQAPDKPRLIGHTVKLNVNPKNPNIIDTGGARRYITSIILIVAGFAIIIMGGMLFMILIGLF